MSRSLLILGSGGQGKMALDCALSMGVYDDIAFLTNDMNAPEAIAGYKVLRGSDEDLRGKMSTFDEVFVAVGDNSARELLTRSCEDADIQIATLVHRRSYVSPFAQIGCGSIIMPNASVNAFAKLGAGCIVNTGAVVEHDCRISPFVHVSPCAAMGGGVEVGSRSWLCIGACVKDHVTIGHDVVVGANSCVLHDIAEPGTYIGTPARIYLQD